MYVSIDELHDCLVLSFFEKGNIQQGYFFVKSYLKNYPCLILPFSKKYTFNINTHYQSYLKNEITLSIGIHSRYLELNI